MKSNNFKKNKLIYRYYVDLRKQNSKSSEIKNNTYFLTDNQSSTSLNNDKGGQIVNPDEYFNPMNQSITKIDGYVLDNSILIKAKYLYCFYDTEKKEKVFYTDIEIRKYRRNLKFFQFATTYNEYYFEKKNISIFSFVVEKVNYEKVKDFINSISKRFKRNNEVIYGYVWCADYCYKSKKQHYHILMATSLLSDEKRRKILELKGDKEKFKYVDLEKPFGLIFYIKKKNFIV
jgi:hypothetical protein